MWIQLAIILLLVCLGIIAFLRFNFTITTVHGGSMYPTLTEGDRLLTLKLLPRLWLQKQQIVVGAISELDPSSIADVFLQDLMADSEAITDVASVAPEVELLGEEVETQTLESDYSKFIKRIIGLPGDTVCIPISTLHEFMQTVLRSRCDADGNLVWTVPEDHCFVRGDGLISMDSLTVGPIPLSALTGIALLKLPRRSDVDSVQQLKGVCDEA